MTGPTDPATDVGMTVEDFRSGLCAWLDDNDLTPGPDHSLAAHIEQMSRVRRALYGGDFVAFLAGAPANALVAEGSAVAVRRGVRLAGQGAA